MGENAEAAGADTVNHDDACSDSSEDEDSPDHEQFEKAEATVFGRWDGGINVDLLPRVAVYHRHSLSRTIHLQEDETGLKFVCGIGMSMPSMSCFQRGLRRCFQCAGSAFRDLHADDMNRPGAKFEAQLSQFEVVLISFKKSDYFRKRKRKL